LKFAFYLSILILLIPVIMTYCIVGTHIAFGQNTTPPPLTPTPVPTPTPTSPNPNFQYLPQKAGVTVYAPEVGIPQNAQPLQVVPQVIPQQIAPQQQSGTIGGMDIGDIFAMVVSAGSGLAAKLGWDKAKKAQQTGQENSAMNVKQGIVQEETLKLAYENMGAEKANAITNKPEIRLTEVAKNNDKAVETATKS
jgi:hypothetical protein